MTASVPTPYSYSRPTPTLSATIHPVTDRQTDRLTDDSIVPITDHTAYHVPNLPFYEATVFMIIIVPVALLCYRKPHVYGSTFYQRAKPVRNLRKTRMYSDMKTDTRTANGRNN